MNKKYSSKNSSEDEITEMLLKKGLVKNFSVGDIVIVKLKDQTNPWPGKISQFFIQQIKQKKTHSQQQEYNPTSQTTNKTKTTKRKSSINNKKLQLIYKVRYYGCQEFVYSQEKFIEPYTLKMEQQLQEVKNRTLSKALELARKEMSEHQRQQVNTGKVPEKKTNPGTGRKKKTLLQEDRENTLTQSNNRPKTQQKKDIQQHSNGHFGEQDQQPKRDQECGDSYTTEVEVIEKKALKKKKLQEKILKLQEGLEKQAKKLINPYLDIQKPHPQSSTQPSPSNAQPSKISQNIPPNPSRVCSVSKLIDKPSQQANTQQKKNNHIPELNHQPTAKPHSQQVGPEYSQPIVKQQYIEADEPAQPVEPSRTLSNDSSQQISTSQQLQQQQPEELSSLLDLHPESSHNITITSESLHHDESTPMLSGTQHSRKPLKKIVKEEYLLDNILYKNKYQLIGVFTQLLEWCLTKLLWIHQTQSHQFIQSQVVKVKRVTLEDQKKLITLRKILDAQIFTLDELQKSQCMQKMLNIIKIGELTQIWFVPHQVKAANNKDLQAPKPAGVLSEKQAQYQMSKKLLKIYGIIQGQLRHFGKLDLSVGNKNKLSSTEKQSLKQMSFGQAPMPYEQKKHDQETSSSDYVQTPALERLKNWHSKQRFRGNLNVQDALKIDYTAALCLTSEELGK